MSKGSSGNCRKNGSWSSACHLHNSPFEAICGKFQSGALAAAIYTVNIMRRKKLTSGAKTDVPSIQNNS